jgi:transposase
MRMISLDLRERIVAAYDEQQGTREEIGRRFRVSTAMVKKLLAQRRRIGELGPQRHRCGRKPLFNDGDRKRLRELVARQPDVTLAEMRSSPELSCTLPAIHYLLQRLGLTYKKRRSMRASKAGRT